MKIRGLMMDPITNMPIVILKEATGSGILPIWVGVYEANAIALEIEKVVDISEWKKLGYTSAQEILTNGGSELMADIKLKLKK